MYRRTSNTNGATANYWVPGAEFGAPVSSASQVCFCFKSLDSNCVCSQGFTFDIPLSRYCTLTTCLFRCSQAQQYNVARGFARPVGTPGANSPLVSGHECCKFVFTNSTSPLTQGRVPRRGHSAFFPASPVPNFAPARSFRGGGNGNGYGSQVQGPVFPSTNFGSIPTSASSIPRAAYVQPALESQILGTGLNHFDTSNNVVPKPDPTLQARLKPVAAEEAERRDRKVKMSAVDDAMKSFSRRFTGNMSENWLEHVNELERRLAIKHTWTPKQFY